MSSGLIALSGVDSLEVVEWRSQGEPSRDAFRVPAISFNIRDLLVVTGHQPGAGKHISAPLRSSGLHTPQNQFNVSWPQHSRCKMHSRFLAAAFLLAFTAATTG